MPDVGPVPNDDCGGPVGVGVLVAVPTLEYRLALPVASVAGIPQRGQVWDVPGAGHHADGMEAVGAERARVATVEARAQGRRVLPDALRSAVVPSITSIGLGPVHTNAVHRE